MKTLMTIQTDVASVVRAQKKVRKAIQALEKATLELLEVSKRVVFITQDIKDNGEEV